MIITVQWFLAESSFYLFWWTEADLNQRPSTRQALMLDYNVNWVGFREWCNGKYAKTWAPTVFCYAKKYHEMLSDDFGELEDEAWVIKKLV